MQICLISPILQHTSGPELRANVRTNDVDPDQVGFGSVDPDPEVMK